MIVGIGVDIIEINRIEEAVKKQTKFIEKLFSNVEIEYFKSKNMRSEFIAGRFAAKEAVSKALGTGFSGFSPRDIVIDRTVSGKPIVVLEGKAKLIAQKLGNYKIHLSISHSRDNAIAQAIMEVLDDEDREFPSHE